MNSNHYCYLNQSKNQNKENQTKPKLMNNQIVFIFFEPKTKNTTEPEPKIIIWKRTGTERPYLNILADI